MIAPQIFAQLQKKFPGRVKENEPLRGWTTFHCAASARAIVTPTDLAELVELIRFLASNHLQWRVDWQIIGRGSNLLVRDGGFPGVLLDLSEGFSHIQALQEGPEKVTVRAEGGVPNGTLLSWARERTLGGIGWVYGIPGSVGGGVRMNAGTPLGWYSKVVTHVEGVDPVGRSVAFPVTEEDFKYRDFPLGRDLVITAVHFLLRRSDPAAVDVEIEAAKEKRKGQPIDLPNFGSVFKNPTGDHAGRLIEAAGLKGLRIGEAEISKQHANFIVNLGSAKTADALALMKRAAEDVKKRFQIDLEPEVHLIGVET